MPTPRIYVYTFCWNEEAILPFFLDHYGRFAERIVVYDNGSTDRTVEIASAHPRCECYSFDTGGKFEERVLTTLRNRAWKEHRDVSDWAIVVDADEFLTFEGLDPLAVASHCDARGYSLVQPIGYNIVLDAESSLPAPGGLPLVEAHHLGVHKKKYSKPCMWSTRRVESSELSLGSHSGVFRPMPRVYRDLRIRLYHYRYLGLEHMLARYRLYASRLSEFGREKGYGYQYLFPETRLRAEYEDAVRRRRDIRSSFSRSPVLGPVLRAAYGAVARMGMRL
ncbi:MAG TPA: glycosyltransferase family 2 protein [Anaeromyxobacteraceae bacterium]|nr:glycosyltransferase family 2 protein [Anaeromyxobacteraceae bacterium]